MSSSGFKMIKFQIMTNDNKQQELSDSTDTAIDYSTCYTSLQQDDSDLLFHECPNCNCRCNCTDQPCSCCNEV
jgi:hypothetical protein